MSWSIGRDHEVRGPAVEVRADRRTDAGTDRRADQRSVGPRATLVEGEAGHGPGECAADRTLTGVAVGVGGVEGLRFTGGEADKGDRSERYRRIAFHGSLHPLVQDMSLWGGIYGYAPCYAMSAASIRAETCQRR